MCSIWSRGTLTLAVLLNLSSYSSNSSSVYKQTWTQLEIPENSGIMFAKQFIVSEKQTKAIL